MSCRYELYVDAAAVGVVWIVLYYFNSDKRCGERIFDIFTPLGNANILTFRVVKKTYRIKLVLACDSVHVKMKNRNILTLILIYKGKRGGFYSCARRDYTSKSACECGLSHTEIAVKRHEAGERGVFNYLARKVYTDTFCVGVGARFYGNRERHIRKVP